MATRSLVAGRLAGDPNEEYWWFLITELEVRTPLDGRMRDIILEARRRGKIKVYGITPEINGEIEKLLSADT